MVYEILQQHALCDYYSFNENPGTSQRVAVRKEKFAFLEDVQVQQQLISFRDEEQIRVSLYLPQIHCSSCLYLLENLHRLDKKVISGRVNFERKEIDLVLSNESTSLRQAAELLTSVGYEPYISLSDLDSRKPKEERLPARRRGFLFR